MIARESMLRGRAVKSSSVETSATIESASSTIEAAVRENSAVRHPAVVVEHNTVMPVPSPVPPAPAKPPEEANPKTKTECKSRPVKVYPWIPVPAWPGRERLSIDQPGIVLRHVNNLRIGRLDHK